MLAWKQSSGFVNIERLAYLMVMFRKRI
jgi:hypothetical protein